MSKQHVSINSERRLSRNTQLRLWAWIITQNNNNKKRNSRITVQEKENRVWVDPFFCRTILSRAANHSYQCVGKIAKKMQPVIQELWMARWEALYNNEWASHIHREHLQPSYTEVHEHTHTQSHTFNNAEGIVDGGSLTDLCAISSEIILLVL